MHRVESRDGLLDEFLEEFGKGLSFLAAIKLKSGFKKRQNYHKPINWSRSLLQALVFLDNDDHIDAVDVVCLFISSF